MILTKSHWMATFLLYVLSSGFLHAASKDSDSALLPYEDEPAQKTTLISLAPPLQASASTPAPHPVGGDIVIPEIARGYEDIYRRFVMGKLIFRPNPDSDEGKIELSIRDLDNPLEGTFDLSLCGDAGQYLSISTGYRKYQKPENLKKVEIWITPRFLIGRELDLLDPYRRMSVLDQIINEKSKILPITDWLNPLHRYYRNIMSEWNPYLAPVGLFWTWRCRKEMKLPWGKSISLDIEECYDRLITDSMDVLSSENLYEKHARALGGPGCRFGSGHTHWDGYYFRCNVSTAVPRHTLEERSFELHL